MLYGGFVSEDTSSRNEIIRQRYIEGETLSDIARDVGLTPQRVYQIVHHRRK
jgi:DNA-directed RNA polymerase specialized sigma subunit